MSLVNSTVYSLVRLSLASFVSYRDHFAMLADVIKIEKNKVKSKEIDHIKVFHQCVIIILRNSSKMLGSLKTRDRKRIEDEINQVQPVIFRDDDIQHFRDLDASRIQWKF